MLHFCANGRPLEAIMALAKKLVGYATFVWLALAFVFRWVNDSFLFA